MPRLESGAWSCSCAARARHAARPGEAAPKADAMQSPSPSAGRAEREASGGAATTWRQHLVQRSVVLFVVGAFMALVLNLLQIQRNVTLFPDEVIATLFSSAWWVPPCCGTAAGECRAPPSPPSPPSPPPHPAGRCVRRPSVGARIALPAAAAGLPAPVPPPPLAPPLAAAELVRRWRRFPLAAAANRPRAGPTTRKSRAGLRARGCVVCGQPGRGAGGSGGSAGLQSAVISVLEVLQQSLRALFIIWWC